MADHDTNSKAKPGSNQQPLWKNELVESKGSNNPTPDEGKTSALKKRNDDENDKMPLKARTTYSKNVVVKLSKVQVSEPSSDANDVESSREKPLSNDSDDTLVQEKDSTRDRPDETNSQSDSNQHESQNDKNNILSEKEAKRAERLKRHRNRRRPVAAAKSKDTYKGAEGVAAASSTTTAAAENGGILSEKESRQEKRLQRHREQRQNDAGTTTQKKRSRQRTKKGDVSVPLPSEGPPLQGNDGENIMADEDMVPGAFSVYPEELDPEDPMDDEEGGDLEDEAFDGEAVAVPGVSPRRRERHLQDQLSETDEMYGVDKPKSVFQNKTYRRLLVGLVVLVIVAAIVVLSVILTRDNKDSGSEQESQTTAGQSQIGTAPTASPTASPAPSFATVPVSVVIGFDSITYETGWQLQCNGEIVNEVRAGSYAGYAAFDVIVDTTFVKEGAQCTFTIFDTGSDGLCCKSGEGFYQVFLADQDEVPNKGLVGDGAEFATSQSLKFVAVAT